ncbi:hypothetical protein Tco_1336776, partial [Tanacetum coccineum]
MYNGRVKANTVVKEIVNNGICEWPTEWTEKFLILNLHKCITLDISKSDELVWRSRSGKESKFSIKQAYDDLKGRVEEDIDLHQHLFFQCQYANQFWAKAKSKIGVNFDDMNWNDLINFVSNLYNGNSINSVVRRLGIAACVYLIWRIGWILLKGVCSPFDDAGLYLCLSFASKDAAASDSQIAGILDLIYKREELVIRIRLKASCVRVLPNPDPFNLFTVHSRLAARITLQLPIILGHTLLALPTTTCRVVPTILCLNIDDFSFISDRLSLQSNNRLLESVDSYYGEDVVIYSPENMYGHIARGCRGTGNANNNNNKKGTGSGQKPTCYGGVQGRLQKDGRPRQKNNKGNRGNQAGNDRAPAKV